ncbi:MAG: sulfatase-like hydrolase/transferase [bacterium]
MPNTPYNIIFVISDQHQAACTGYEGHPQAITPNMDRLAAEGVRFTDAYTQNPICTPSRMSFFTGQYCHNHGIYGLSGPSPDHLPGFLGHFKSNGYRTAGIGKLHTPNDPQDWLLNQVDLYAESYNYGGKFECNSSAYFDYLRELGIRDKEDSITLPEFSGAQQDEARPSQLPYEHSVEGWCVKKAIEFMGESQKAGKLFCMQVSLPRPHQCYTPDQIFWDMYPDDLELPETINQDTSKRPPHFQQMVQRGKTWEGLIDPKGVENVRRRVWHGYLACITQVDFALGQLLDYLDQNRLADNTIVIYGSDHGAYSGTFGVPEKAPGICSQAVCRVPYIWRVPGVTKGGHVSHQLVENIDLTPTITALCGLPAMETVDGKDISTLLSGDETSVRSVAVTENPWSKAIRWDEWRMVHYQPQMFGGEEFGELYNIRTDPNETTNLFDNLSYRDVVAEGRKRLLEWLIDTTRVVSVWPAVDWANKPYNYKTVEDGKESNTAGPAYRAGINQLNYL